MNVIDSGSNTSTGTVTIGQSTVLLKIGLHSGSSANVTLNGKTVHITKDKGYEDFPGDYPTFAVTSGTIDWVAFG